MLSCGYVIEGGICIHFNEGSVFYITKKKLGFKGYSLLIHY